MRNLYPKFNKNIFSSFTSKAIPFPKLHFLFILFLVAGLDNNAYSQPGPAWEYSRAINLSSPTPLVDYQVQVVLPAGQYGDMKADGSDLRFYVGATACNFWVEKWNTSGQSVIWVKVPVAGTGSITMYYGNAAAASTASPGTAVFDFFDDFNVPLNSAEWANISYHTVQAGTTVTISDGGFISNKITFPVATPSFFVEAKNVETMYNSARYYLTTSTGDQTTKGSSPISPTGFDYGYFTNPSGNSPTANIYWNGFSGKLVTANTNYLTQWQVTDGGAFNWTTFNLEANPYMQVYSRSTTASPLLRYITIVS